MIIQNHNRKRMSKILKKHKNKLSSKPKMKHKFKIKSKTKGEKTKRKEDILYYSHSEMGSVQLGFIDHFLTAI